MQKLIFENADGAKIDLTSGYFGITKWEGFSNVSANVQTQTVPFVDGSVYLDALLEDRELTVTLAINDGNNLSLRYALKEELIKALNPKNGEGYLYYANDNLERRIKCVAMLPIFENKNSNDSGTLKASVTFTACNPYWEDVGETQVYVPLGTSVEIDNSGDVATGFKFEAFGDDIINPEIKNLTAGTNTGVSGMYDNFYLDSNVGNKRIESETVSYAIKSLYTQANDVTYIPERKELVIAANDLYHTQDGKTFGMYDISGAVASGVYKVRKFAYEQLDADNSRMLAILENRNSGNHYVILRSKNNGADWLQYDAGYNVNAVVETKPVQLQDVDTPPFPYYDTPLLVAFCDGGVVRCGYRRHAASGEDSLPFKTGVSSTTANFRGAIYLPDKTVHYRQPCAILAWTDAAEVLYTNSDSVNVGIVFDKYTVDEAFIDIIRVAENRFLGVTATKIRESEDGITWTDVCELNGKSISKMGYDTVIGFIGFNSTSQTMYITKDFIIWKSFFFPASDFAYNSNNGELTGVSSGRSVVTSDDFATYTNMAMPVSRIKYSKTYNRYYATGDLMQIWSGTDLKNWTAKGAAPGLLNDISESPDGKVILSFTGGYAVTTDGENFDTVNTGVNTIIKRWNNIYFGCFGTQRGVSHDGVSWAMYSGAYAEARRCVIVGSKIIIASGGNIEYSDGSATFTQVQVAGSPNYVGDICYMDSRGYYFCNVMGINKQFISYDLDTWQEVRASETYRMAYVPELMQVVCLGMGSVTTTTDAVNWNYKKFSTSEFSDVTFNSRTNELVIVDYMGSVYTSIVTAENIISNITADSTMSMVLEKGKNKIYFTASGGSGVGKITYTKKYIGV